MKHTINQYKPEFAPAYVANGFVGLRIGENPLAGGTALVNGYAGLHETERIESYAPVPYPLCGDVNIDGLWSSQRPDWVRFQEQVYDFSCGELVTRLEFTAGEVTAQIDTLTFCSRALPTLAIQETRVSVTAPCTLTLRAAIDPDGVPGRCLTRDMLGVKWYVAEGSLHWESVGGLGTCGLAMVTEFPGEARKDDHAWGHANAIMTDYTVEAEPGREYLLRQMTSLVPSLLHAEPDRQAVRLVRIGYDRGFEGVREDNRRQWAELWKGRVRLIGAEPRWQEITDAAFFYLHSSVHQSTPCSVAAWGLSRWQNYMGHVFWDADFYILPALMLTAPHAARAMLDYRSRRLDQARANAALNGYRGVQFPWESLTRGDEVTPAWAAAIFLEQHINLDVAHAFAQYAYATGDEEFMLEQAWPALRGVAQWIESRVQETPRGYEIRNITGVAEEVHNIHNNSFTNIAAVLVLREAMICARRVGKIPPPVWQDIAERMFIPVDEDGVILKHDAYHFAGEYSVPEPLLTLFPMGYQTTEQITTATVDYYLNLLPYYIGMPLIPSLTGVFAARLGDRERAMEMFERGLASYVTEPFLQFIEHHPHEKAPFRPPITTYLANSSGFLMACLYGLAGLQLGPGEPQEWCHLPVAMPSGWEGIEVERIWVHGHPARLSARHGDTRAVITTE